MSGPRVMLVDESPFFLDLQQSFLKETLAKITVCQSVADVRELLLQGLPELIYMDIGAPTMDGAQTCAYLKQHSRFADIPVLLICSRDEHKEKALCFRAGCQGVLTKPLERKSFLAMGRKFLPNIERRLQRVLCSMTIFFRSDSDHHYAASMDLSVGGMFLETDYPGENGQEIDLAFNLPGNARDIIEVSARIVWVNMADHLLRCSYPIGFGVEFTQLPAIAETLIQQFVTENIDLQKPARPDVRPPGKLFPLRPEGFLP